MKAKNKVIRLRKRHPFMPTVDIAKEVGITRQYAREVLLKNNLQTNPPKPKRVVYCTQKCYQDKRKNNSANRQRSNIEMGTENQQDGIQHLYTWV